MPRRGSDYSCCLEFCDFCVAHSKQAPEDLTVVLTEEGRRNISLEGSVREPRHRARVQMRSDYCAIDGDEISAI